jgi:GDP-L-fucose synthase
MKKNSKITVFGGSGMLGSAVKRRLQFHGYENITTPMYEEGFNLLDKKMVDDFLKREQPEFAFMVAGLVGGINANNMRQADFLYQNSLMILNVLQAITDNSRNTKLLFTGSTCIYPRENPQPINENRLLQGVLEETNKGYAIAKILGILGCELYKRQYNINAIAAMPTNMYGPNDNFNLETGHFIGALVQKFVNAKTKNITPVFWGTGKPKREALFVEDCADALIFLMNNYNNSKIVNIGTGFDNTITEYVEIARKIFKYEGEIKWDETKPDGTMEKRTDISYLKSIMPEYKPRKFEEGLKAVINTHFKDLIEVD